MNPAAAASTYSREKTEDLALIRRVAAGDESAFFALYDRWQRVVSALADRILADADEADDVVEETFWQAWRGAARFDASRGSVQTWLLTIARTRSLDRLRARRRRREESADDQDPDAPPSTAAVAADPAGDASAGAEQAEQRTMIRTALAGLPAEQRTTVELAYFAGLSQSEIAAAKMGEPLGTVKTQNANGAAETARRARRPAGGRTVMPTPMGHDEARDLLAPLALDGLDAAEEARVLAHVATCAECTADLRELRATAAAVALTAPAPDNAKRAAAVKGRLMARVQASKTVTLTPRSAAEASAVRNGGSMARRAAIAATVLFLASSAFGAMLWSDPY